MRNSPFDIPLVFLLALGFVAIAQKGQKRKHVFSPTKQFTVSPTVSVRFTVQRRSCTEPIYGIRADQLFFLLSRNQVRGLYQLLIDIQSSASQQKRTEEDSDDGTERTLDAKIRFVPRSAHLQYPAILSLTTLNLELTSDEFETLIIQVMFLAQDLDTHDAVWLFAISSGQELFHLVRKEQGVRDGPVLCGCLPSSENMNMKGWLFSPLVGPLEKDHICPSCLEKWEREPHALVSHLVESSSRKSQQEDEVWFEV